MEREREREREREGGGEVKRERNIEEREKLD